MSKNKRRTDTRMSYWVLFFPNARETVMDLDLRNSSCLLFSRLNGVGQSQFHSVERGDGEGTHAMKSYPRLKECYLHVTSLCL